MLAGSFFAPIGSNASIELDIHLGVVLLERQKKCSARSIHEPQGGVRMASNLDDISIFIVGDVVALVLLRNVVTPV